MFARLSPLVLETLAGELVGREVQAGETVIREGKAAIRSGLTLLGF